jgi:hypothetical protein
MGRPCLFDKPMTPAERQRRHRRHEALRRAVTYRPPPPKPAEIAVTKSPPAPPPPSPEITRTAATPGRPPAWFDATTMVG